MGYDLRVTRAANWYENSGREITKEEWLELVRDNPDIKLDMHWSRGNLVSKNPDASIIANMIQVAARLKARVEGDDGETYLAEGRVQLANGRIAEDRDWRNW